MEFTQQLLLIISILLLFACYTDLTRRRISNITSLLVMFFSLLLGFINNDCPSFFPALSILIVGFFLSARGVIGAGDVKIASALALGLTSGEVCDFLLLTGFSGIPVTIAMLVYYKVKAYKGCINVPYGLAIAGGYWLQTFLS